MLKFLQRGSKPLTQHVEGRGISPHQQTYHVDRLQQHIRMPWENLDAALAYGPHEIFYIVHQIANRLESHGIGGPLERMSRPEELVNHVRIVLFLLEPKQLGF